MTKEIIVNAGEMESRVAILENGRLMELHVERDPKIVGNVYKGRVTKVLKGMDAAFVDIGIEQNAFLSVSDVVPQDDDEDGGNGRISRHELPPITQLLHANQEILAQVVRAPMGTKGARITTRLSLPGRYMVLMLHGGTYVGVSRKIDDVKERQRLRTIANAIRPENYSLIVRTEAEGKTEEELRQDLAFLLDMAHKLEDKAARVSAPALVHGDLNLIMRLIRDAFTRDVNRLVVDSPDAYENIVELVNMISPGLRNRVFLYDEPVPIFHAYNIENEIDRTVRRKIWLPSGGHLVVDQAEALIAIDVNTGRFVGSVELAETVLTTNLQAAEEVARQLRLRDLGGIIVVDFIDMDNPKHRQQVMHAFEEALKRDRAKIKVHNISHLGLVEMTRKRTGESLSDLLTEPCPYCSGIGRIQNPITMALRLQRELAAAAVEYPATEAFSVTAHPRVIASILGYEGEVHRDLEQYLERSVYLRSAEEYHPNTYQVERLTLEQVMAAVSHVEDGDVVEGRVVNPDPALSLSPLVMAKGVYLVVPELDAPVGAMVKVRVTNTGTSLAFAEPLAEELRGVRAEERPHAIERPPLLPESVLPPYLREERRIHPPRELTLLSPTAASGRASEEEPATYEAREETGYDRKKRRRRRKDQVDELPETPPSLTEAGEALDEVVMPGETAAILEASVDATLPVSGEEAETATRRRRRRRGRRGRGKGTAVEAAVTDEGEEIVGASEEAEEVTEAAEPVTAASAEDEKTTTATAEEGAEEAPARKRRRRSRSRRKTQDETSVLPLPELPQMPEMPALPTLPDLEPIHEVISSEEADEALQTLLNAIPEPETPAAEPVAEEEAAEPAMVEALASRLLAAEEIAGEAPPEEPAPRRTRTRRPRRKTTAEDTAGEVAAAPTPDAAPAPAPAHEAETAAAPAAEAAAEPEPAPAAETEPVLELETVEPAPRRRRPSRRKKAPEDEEQPPAAE